MNESLPREEILGRIKSALEGLKKIEPRPELEDQVIRQLGDAPRARLIERFAEQIEALGDSCLQFASVGEMTIHLCSQIRSRFPHAFGIADGDAVSLLGEEAAELVTNATSECSHFDADFGVFTAPFAVAETGSIVVVTGEESSRLTSLAPPVTWCILRAEDIMPDLIDAVRRFPPAQETSAVTIITGSSRTADIDGILVRGAHGPRELIVLIVGEPEEG